MIVIVDYGIGNLKSVANMLKRAGADAKISSSPDDIAKADKIVLPGVGHFDYGMRTLRASNLVEPVTEFAFTARKPVLGICLGAQLLGKGSDEGTEPGLGWLDLWCRKIPPAEDIKVPHMGWNQLLLKKPSYLLNSLNENSRFYFVHSYYMDCESDRVIATTRHGIEFACVVGQDNIVGTQFHPEKSLRHGLAVMRDFARGAI